jgi:hypothetical protein
MAFSGMGGGGGNTSYMIDEPTDGSVDERPLVAKLLSNETYKAQYHTIIQSMIDNYLNDEVFHARVKQLQELIADDVKADPTAFYAYEQFEQGVQSLLTFTSNRVASVQGQLDGTVKASGNGSGNGGGFGGRGAGFGGGRRGGNNMAANGQNNAAVQGGNAVQGVNAVQDVNGVQNGNNAPAAQDFGGGMGAPPDGFGGGGFGGMVGGPGGFGGNTVANVNQGSTKDAITTGSLLIVLVLAMFFVVNFRKKH